MWELFSPGHIPYEHLSVDAVPDAVKSRKLLEKPLRCPAGLFTTMLVCWAENTQDRPRFLQLHQLLSAEASSHPKESSGSLQVQTSSQKFSRSFEESPVIAPSSVSVHESSASCSSGHYVNVHDKLLEEHKYGAPVPVQEFSGTYVTTTQMAESAGIDVDEPVPIHDAAGTYVNTLLINQLEQAAEKLPEVPEISHTPMAIDTLKKASSSFSGLATQEMSISSLTTALEVTSMLQSQGTNLEH